MNALSCLSWVQLVHSSATPQIRPPFQNELGTNSPSIQFNIAQKRRAARSTRVNIAVKRNNLPQAAPYPVFSSPSEGVFSKYDFKFSNILPQVRQVSRYGLQ